MKDPRDNNDLTSTTTPSVPRNSCALPTKMGISHTTARWLAPLSFLVNVAAQTYGMLTTPNMQDVHEANLSFFSPHPAFIGAFFSSQQIFQLMWLYRLCRPNPRGRLSFLRNTDPINQDLDDDVALMVDYAPYYAVGNFCIAGMPPISTPISR